MKTKVKHSTTLAKFSSIATPVSRTPSAESCSAVVFIYVTKRDKRKNNGRRWKYVQNQKRLRPE